MNVGPEPAPAAGRATATGWTDLPPLQAPAEALPARIWRRRWLILACTILFIIGGGIYLAVAPRTYKAVSILALENLHARPTSADTSSEHFLAVQRKLI